MTQFVIIFSQFSYLQKTNNQKVHFVSSDAIISIENNKNQIYFQSKGNTLNRLINLKFISIRWNRYLLKEIIEMENAINITIFIWKVSFEIK